MFMERQRCIAHHSTADLYRWDIFITKLFVYHILLAQLSNSF
ncbi:hypothetical protein O166_14705 [Pseudogulbenkiania ferrooxidans EGD-HP2]|uniref:Transposase n=1 Tax=Pseudogulbenkiania ferrooxidans EGD-HP2 TaxID=1388764 RepID=A0ABN0N2R9_9NEIS|nr:hypothetical protein O166_14705 [Pseudogulbenkiania ferrooxidans EGD-HP2]